MNILTSFPTYPIVFNTLTPNYGLASDIFYYTPTINYDIYCPDVPLLLY